VDGRRRAAYSQADNGDNARHVDQPGCDQAADGRRLRSGDWHDVTRRRAECPLWHGGGANQTLHPRLGVILEYAAGWLRPQENHCLAVPRDVVRDLPERLQELLGYNIYPPFVGYVDGSHPRRVLSADL
jgi:hypothetical protein